MDFIGIGLLCGLYKWTLIDDHLAASRSGQYGKNEVTIYFIHIEQYIYHNMYFYADPTNLMNILTPEETMALIHTHCTFKYSL